MDLAVKAAVVKRIGRVLVSVLFPAECSRYVALKAPNPLPRLDIVSGMQSKKHSVGASRKPVNAGATCPNVALELRPPIPVVPADVEPGPIRGGDDRARRRLDHKIRRQCLPTCASSITKIWSLIRP